MKKIITIGEIMQRLTTQNDDRLIQAQTLSVTYGGSEANIAMALANFGHPVSFVTKLPSHPLGEAAHKMLKSFGVQTDHIIFGGETLGTYYVETGYSYRPTNVIYNRKHSSFATITRDEFDIESLLVDKEWLHVSGITLALGDEIQKFTIDLVKLAFHKGLTVSFDFNYRAKLWSVEQASEAFAQVLPYVHICFASLYDIEVLGGFGEMLDKEYDSIEDKRYQVFKHYMVNSNCHYIFGTVRTQKSIHQNSLSAYCYTANGESYHTQTYEFEIVDRVGGGDAFVAGVLHELELDKHNYKDATKCGLACGVLKHTINGDVLLASVAEVRELMDAKQHINIKR